MVANNLVLIPGTGGVGRAVFDHLRTQDVPVRFMVRREDERAAEVKGLGAEVVIGDLTRPETVAAALHGVSRMFFAMACTVPKPRGHVHDLRVRPRAAPAMIMPWPHACST